MTPSFSRAWAISPWRARPFSSSARPTQRLLTTLKTQCLDAVAYGITAGLCPDQRRNAAGAASGAAAGAVLAHIRWPNTRFLDVLQAGIAEGIALVPLAVLGLMGGDDCPGSTAVATSALMAELKARSPAAIMDEAALE